jgi:FkbM family methyltransferase
MRLAPKHFVYASELAQHFDKYFCPLVPIEERGYSVLDYSRPGILQTYAGSGLQFEMPSWPEEEDEIEGYFTWYTPGPGDTVFDIGAHCGVSTHRFSTLVGQAGRVIAFEPDPVNFSLLLRNIERHNLTNVIPVRIAIAGTRGMAQFSCEETIGSMLTRHSRRASVGKVAMVETITLEDSFVKWGTPAFCKIDIEGSELEVIGAAREFLRNQHCEFALDTSHVVGGAFTDKRIEALFRGIGFEALSSDSGMKTTWARPSA